MIFVTVGTNEAAFDRLLEAVKGLQTGDEEIVVQHGSSAIRPANASRTYDFLLFDDLVEVMRSARVVVTHAGIGSIMTALSCGRRPVVAARLVAHREAVDDHQLPVARRLEAAGLVTLVEDLSRLDEAVAKAGEQVEVSLGADERLVTELRDYIRDAIGYSR
ncbi:MAG: glycosyltransferase [Actinobacteria bacterium]|nr:glycosyltransferase [Actinomycetota bacterium]